MGCFNASSNLASTVVVLTISIQSLKPCHFTLSPQALQTQPVSHNTTCQEQQLLHLYDQIFISIIIQLTMQRFHSPNPQPQIFSKITPQARGLIQRDSLHLRSLFSLNSSNGPEVGLVLTNLYIAVFIPKMCKEEVMFHTELSFEVKFQTIYQLDGKCGVEESVLSNPVGFRITKEGKAKVQFYSKCTSLAELWLRQLARHLNQYGFSRHYKYINQIGKGSFARVIQVERVTDKKRFAVKALTKHPTGSSKDYARRLTLLNEIQMLRTFDSPHLLKCQAVFQSEKSIYVVLELLQYGHLQNRISQPQRVFSLDQLREFMRGMALGLKEMHDYRIMHRDVKPQNIMMRNEKGLEPVIADFGLCTDSDLEDYTYYRCGSPGYMAPEVLSSIKGTHIQPQCDIFSLGAIFHLLLIQRPLFEGKKWEEIYASNKAMKISFSSARYKRVDSQAMDLLRRMLKINPKERIKAEEILSHPFLKMQELQTGMEKSNETLASNKEITRISKR